jgi:hypothetical protein
MLVRNVSMVSRLVVLEKHQPQVVAAGEVVVLAAEPGVWMEESVLVPPPPPELTPP